MSNVRVRIPQIRSIQTALTLYYTKSELSNRDIVELFDGKLSSATVARLKQRAREQMISDGVQAWNSQCVNVKAAYTAWGLSVNDLEERFAKLKELNLL